jgi:predicted  nucleic acid-binding Zn-ribbon protein
MTLDSRLLDLQQHDDGIDRISRRLASLTEAEAVCAAEADHDAQAARVAEIEQQRAALERERQRCDDAIALLDDELRTVAAALDGGGGANPREAAALTSKREMLERNKTELEDVALEAMLAIEELAPDELSAQSALESAAAALESARASLDEVAGALEAERAEHLVGRAEVAAAVDTSLVAAYEKSRARGGAGAARLEAGTCQGCHIKLSPDDLGDLASAPVPKCPECAALLVLDS